LPPAQALGNLGRGQLAPRANRTEEQFVIASKMTRLLVAALVAGVFATVGVGGQSSSASAATNRQLALGVSVFAWESLKNVDDFTASVGRRPASWTIWNDWGGPRRGFPDINVMNGLYQRGIVPLVFWQPVDPTSDSQWAYNYKNILAGRWDSYILQWATAAKAYGHTVLVRFAHEMDGRWFPWSIYNHGNSPERFIGAWRHIWDIFHYQARATNVKFIWSPLKPAERQRLYPGDKYVDYVGFTALNWGTATPNPDDEWRSMSTIIKARMKDLQKVTRKPVIVCELASSSHGGNKASWISKGYEDVYLRYPQIRELVYFNVDMRYQTQPDWRLQTPSTALQAYRNLASKKHFRGALR